MTIQRRIFLSNILMIVLTLLIGLLVFFAARFLVVDADTQTRGGTGGRFMDLPHIPVVGTSNANTLFETGDFSYREGVSLYQSDLGDFIIVLPDSELAAIEDFIAGPNFVLPLILVYLIIVGFLGNILLAKYITRRIMTPINTLANGVQEIASGNLNHRIHYQSGDEFDTVCADFNEMASRLSQMVLQKQADEDSRKELLAGISHDLKTPLTSVKAYLEGLRKGVATTPQMQEKYLDTIQKKTEDIEYIITQLFYFSQIDIGEFPLQLERVDIGAQLNQMLPAFVEEYGKMGLRVSLTENTNVAVSIDVVQFQNILQNILGNSVKYAICENPHVEITCTKVEDGRVGIRIQDNGPGVSAETLPKIFDVFYRGDKARTSPDKGSGLGLSISAKMIKRFGGTIHAENGIAGGLAIIITLPIQKGEN